MTKTKRNQPDSDDRLMNVSVLLPLAVHRRLKELAKAQNRSKRGHAAYILTRECGWRAGETSGQLDKAAG